MRHLLIGLGVVAGGAASAQVAGAPGGGGPTAFPPGAYAPNFYNRQTQPLSPYLNLLRGGNPGVNYFYGVRPGLQPGVASPGGAFGFQGAALGPPGAGNRFYFQPPAGEGELPYQPFDAAQELPVIPTAAHPVTFNARPALGGFRAAGRTGFTPAPANNRGTPTQAPRR